MTTLLSIVFVVVVGAVVYLKFMNKKAPAITPAPKPQDTHVVVTPEIPAPPAPTGKPGKKKPEIIN